MKRIDYGAMFTLRKDGRYCASYTDDTGRHYLYDRDPERLYHKLHRADDGPASFREIAGAWERYHWPQIAPGTQVCYAPALKRAVDMYGDMPATDVRPADIQAHLIRMKGQGYGSKTIKTQKTVYHQIFSYAIADERYGEQIRYDPTAAVTIPRGVKRPVKRDAPSTETIDKIRAGASTAHFGLFPLLLISTGLRRGEALALQWRDVDLSRKTISVSKALHFDGYAWIGETKTENSVRQVPILPDLLGPLTNAQARADEYIFHGKDKTRPLSERSYNRHWIRYCRETGFIDPDGKPTITAHVMRHGYATMLYEAGVDMYTAQRLLGHADIQTTMAIYTHLRQERENESIKKLENYITAQI